MISEALTVLNILLYISVCTTVLMFRHLYGNSATDWVFTELPQLCRSILGSDNFWGGKFNSFHFSLPRNSFLLLTYAATNDTSLTSKLFFLFNHTGKSKDKSSP
jgi:hypothetical protein